MTYDQWKLMTPEEDAALWSFDDEDEVLECECCGDVLDEDTAIQDGASWFCSECWESTEIIGEDEIEVQKENA
ncbi:hypothetical protein [Alicyclobacillus acidocaldarius]|uniref:Uncharacterized protein n=1 Tax=Alicyclobacillus acidocaldarius (strain Tc-4-1) TaxID=1048834 RepID=F8IDE9_ALIAT|nr:hypothetical protein [Alicyclobacillus acidocaldarius]AEJ43802.1 hypothetical protein TC41_1886 [Alicyclobacillus acidocaldarius subsp. acidocaldarius Tc-4-1]